MSEVVLEKIESLRKEQKQNYEHLNQRLMDMINLLRQEMKAKDAAYEQMLNQLTEAQKDLEQNLKDKENCSDVKFKEIETRLDDVESELDIKKGETGNKKENRDSTRFTLSQLIVVLTCIAMIVFEVLSK